MTPELVRFIQNTTVALRGFTREQLYHLPVSIRQELARRDTDALPEADALVAALLADARATRARIYSADYTTDPWWCAPCAAVHAPLQHRRPEPAEKS